MVARKFFGLLIVLLFTVFTFLAPIGASADPCPGEGEAQSFYINPDGSQNLNGTFCVKASLLAAPTKCITKTGEIDCYEFAYTLRAINPGESLSQVGLLIPSKKKCTLSIFSLDRSQKVREYEPSTGFSSTDELTDVITWDALKLDSNNKEDINTYISTLCGYDQSTMQFKTASGLQYVSIYGPACCGVTQTPTQACYFDKLSNATICINYSLCNYEPEGNPQISIEGVSSELELLTKGAAHCEKNDKTGAFDPKLCSPIKKLGPRSGAVILTQKLTTPECTGNSTETCPGYAYYGFGSDIYRYPPMGSGATIEVPAAIECKEFGSCLSLANYNNVPRPTSATIDQFVTFEYDGCGNGKIIGTNTDGSQSDPITCSTTTKPIYVVPYDAAGSLLFSEASKVIAGSPEGVVLEGSSCCVIGGVYMCSYKCGTR